MNNSRLAADATSIKIAANSLFSQQKYAEAVQRYTEGVVSLAEVDLINDKKIWGKQHEPEYKSLSILLCQLLNNRAASNIKLANFKAVLDDTAIVIHLCSLTKLTKPKQTPWTAAAFVRAETEFQEMFHKAQLRRKQAFEAMGNSAKAYEHLCLASCPPAVQFQLDKPTITIPQSVRDEFYRYLTLSHPDRTNLSSNKLDWSLIYAGTWSKLTATGEVPVATTYQISALYQNKIYVFGGRDGTHCPYHTVHVLDLSTLTWSKVRPKSEPSEMPPKGYHHSVALWQDQMVIYLGGHAVWLFDMATEKFKKLKTSKPTSTAMSQAPFLANGSKLLEHCMAVWGDTLYVFGGFNGSLSAAKNYNALVACNLTTGKWEVTTALNEGNDWAYPSLCQNAQMWAADGKIFVLGGRTLMNREDLVDDYTLMDDQYFWEFDIEKGQWTNLGAQPSGAPVGNIPSGRSEFPAAVCGRKVMVHGGYTTSIYQLRENRFLEKCAYLSDTFLYNLDSKEWRMVVADKVPEPRAGASLVHVPTGGGARQSQSGSRSSSKPVEGKVYLFGGYKGGKTTAHHKLDDIWVLKLSGSMKVSGACHGCGTCMKGLKQCAGSCGGSVVVCGVDCHKKVWQEQHKHWCQKLE